MSSSKKMVLLQEFRRKFVGGIRARINWEGAQQARNETVEQAGDRSLLQCFAEAIDEATVGEPSVPLVRARRSHLQVRLDIVDWIRNQPSGRAAETARQQQVLGRQIVNGLALSSEGTVGQEGMT